MITNKKTSTNSNQDLIKYFTSRLIPKNAHSLQNKPMSYRECNGYQHDTSLSKKTRAATLQDQILLTGW